METFEFDVVLATDAAPEDFDGDAFLDATEGPLFEAFEGDVTPAVSVGRPLFSCAVAGPSFTEAVYRVLAVARELGYEPLRIEAEPQVFEPA